MFKNLNFNRTVILFILFIAFLVILTLAQSYDSKTGQFNLPFYNPNLGTVINTQQNQKLLLERTLEKYNRDYSFSNKDCFVTFQAKDSKVAIYISLLKESTDTVKCGATNYMRNLLKEEPTLEGSEVIIEKVYKESTREGEVGEDYLF